MCFAMLMCAQIDDCSQRPFSFALTCNLLSAQHESFSVFLLVFLSLPSSSPSPNPPTRPAKHTELLV